MKKQDIASKSTARPHFMTRLKEKWGLKSMWQVVLILLVFALTGTTVLLIKQPLLQFLGVDMSQGGAWKTVLYLLFVLPLYQLILLFYGALLGQFSFFWEKEKALFRRIFGGRTS
ncbi:hypothetical protein A3SI_16657 [Nitritalea halalkaliphila LW7]|uniref:DUF6787 domain-containing protein n=1 Tax=Nitritalea halalkaliphila LW7 TaxID=1189621 RepID=I5BWX7_9BACT|nr:DUF6787 family protein [Nitritalea halalkaliphila]EIM74079.1 hypothetical protein A3SI_16657 [Nitritalea halalkaliphila LW7]